MTHLLDVGDVGGEEFHVVGPLDPEEGLVDGHEDCDLLMLTEHGAERQAQAVCPPVGRTRDVVRHRTEASKLSTHCLTITDSVDSSVP